MGCDGVGPGPVEGSDTERRQRTSTWRSLRSFELPVQLLVVNQFGVNVGFYMLVPYLSLYLTGDLGLTVALTGLILGIRTLAQQGLMLVGGTIGDRFGFRPAIIVGLAFRSTAFLCFAVWDTITGALVATVLSGLAGSLFGPAVRAYISVAAGDRRAEAFALFNLSANVGMLTGPLLGAVLITVDFRIMATVAAVVFALLALAQLRALPAREVEAPEQSVWQDWKQVLRDRRFLVFTIAASTIFALHNQFYLTLPLEVTYITGVESSTALVFAVSALVTLTVQVRVAAWCRAHWHPAKSLGVGMCVSGAAFLPLALAGASGAHEPAVRGAALVLALLPLIATTAILGLGEATGQPFAFDRIGAMSAPGLSGTYFGMFTMVSGFAATAANTGIGYVRDLATAHYQPWLTWVALAAFGLAGAAGVLGMHARGLLNDRAHTADPGKLTAD